MIAKIQQKKIAQMKMLYDPKGKTMLEWHGAYGFDYAINTVLFDLNYSGLAGYLTTDRVVRCQSTYPYGFASDGKKPVFSYGNNVKYKDFSGFAYATLIRDGAVQVGAEETRKYGYRERSAVGLTADGDIVSYKGQLWECTAVDGGGKNIWEPGVYGWELYSPEPEPGTEDGSKENPFTASRGMTYTYGLYYLDPEDSKTYLCKRTGEADGGTVELQYLPHELVGQYFEEVVA